MTERVKVVIVEDDEDMLDLIRRSLNRDSRIDIVGNGDDARSAAEVVRREHPQLIVLDHYLYGKVMGIDSAPVLKTLAPMAKVVVFTTEDFGFEAHRQPDVDAYLQKDQLDRLLPLIQRLTGLDQDGDSELKTP